MGTTDAMTDTFSNWLDPDGRTTFDRCGWCGAMVMRGDKARHATFHRRLVQAIAATRADIDEVREVGA